MQVVSCCTPGPVSSHFPHLFECFQYLIHVLWMEHLHVLSEPDQTQRDKRGRGRESMEDEIRA
jgi:hypothetical protein